MGSAAAAWNYWWIAAASNNSLGQFSKRSAPSGNIEKRQSAFGIETLEVFNEAFNQTFNLSLSQIADPSVPNPFGGPDNITLTDGSEAGQSIPFWSLIQPERKLDLM
jgi:lysophospholipase